MGSMLWSIDNLLNTFLRPMHMAYQLNQFRTACNFLYDFNQFFNGFGVGIEDLPKPEIFDITMRGRTTPDETFDAYYTKYKPLVSKCMGAYVREVLDKIKLEQQVYGYNR